MRIYGIVANVCKITYEKIYNKKYIKLYYTILFTLYTVFTYCAELNINYCKCSMTLTKHKLVSTIVAYHSHCVVVIA